MSTEWTVVKVIVNDDGKTIGLSAAPNLAGPSRPERKSVAQVAMCIENGDRFFVEVDRVQHSEVNVVLTTAADGTDENNLSDLPVGFF